MLTLSFVDLDFLGSSLDLETREENNPQTMSRPGDLEWYKYPHEAIAEQNARSKLNPLDFIGIS